ncbi:MAG TPA: heparan-alpha-glucosaminide N-acetyltransferase domain-containing protein [Actinomycetospora sp.]|nr:heparan-alpha-glucosaminide N-acetyltransferase domain-containing protein [Actinomycetospora sp.]
MSAAESGEPGRPGRLLGVDAARGIALLGMIAVHSLADITEEGAPTWSFSVAAGRAAAIFAVLAGLGIAFLTGRRRVPVRAGGGAVAASLGVRALVIGALGLALGYTTTEFAAVILPYYAVLFLLAIPLVFVGTRTLAVLAVAMAIGLPVLSQVLRPRVDVPDIENPWFADLVRDPLGLLLELTLMGDYPAMVWVTYLCVGLVVGRLTLSSVRVAGGLLAGGAVLAIGSWVGSSLLLTRAGGLAAIQAGIPASGISAEDTADILAFGADGITPTSTWWWLAVVRAHTGTPLDLAHTIGVALAVLGAMLLLTHVRAPGARRVVAVIQFPLAAVGGLTLTVYTAHIVFINSPLDTLSSAGGYALQLVVFVLFALAWRATAGRGPLEGLVSSLAGAAARRVGGRREGAAGARAPGRSTDQP